MPDRRQLVAVLFGVAALCTLSLLPIHHIGFVATGVLVVAAPIVPAFAIYAWRHRRMVQLLHNDSTPQQLAGIGVRTGSLRDAAFVAGLARPTIYCDRQIADQLTAAELKAVLLHEQAHQRAWDPLRLLVIEVLRPVVRHLPFGKQWLAWAVAQREIAADRYAMSRGAEHRDLVGALLRIPPLAQAHVAGFTSAVDLRLRALLGEDIGAMVPLAVRRASVMFTTTVMGLATSIWFLHRMLSTPLGHVCC